MKETVWYGISDEYKSAPPHQLIQVSSFNSRESNSKILAMNYTHFAWLDPP